MDVLRKHANLIVALILVAFFAVNMLVSSQESTITDEKAHIPAGYSYVRYGDMRLNPEHPPILKDLSGLALLPLQPEFPLDSWEWQEGINEQWTLGDKFINCTAPEQACNDADLITFVSRIPIILVAVILGAFLYFWTRELAGTLAGLLALTLYAFDPNIIAHSHYVTTDIGIAAFMFFAFYFFVRFLKDPSPKNIFWSGIFFGLAQLTKFSAVLLLPIFGLFVILYALATPKPVGSSLSTWLFKLREIFFLGLKFLLSLVIAFVLIYIVYYPHTINMPGEKLSEVAHVMFPDYGLGPWAKSVIDATYGSDILKPFVEFILGVFMVFGRVSGGNTYYFLGTVSNQASPWYFPVVFLLKETLPFLFLLVATTLYTLYRIGKSLSEARLRRINDFWHFLGQSFRSRIAQYLALFFILFYAFISITGNLNIGFRHLFPILPFLYLLIAKTVSDALKRIQNDAWRHVAWSLIGILMLCVMAIPVISYPSYLSYFNAAFGGHTNGYRYVTDSNYDWGQDLKRVRNFVDTHNACVASEETDAALCQKAVGTLPPIDAIRVDYFGGSSPAWYLGDRFLPWRSSNMPEVGWYALSINFLEESLHRESTPEDPTYSWLKDIQPVARAGDSIFIFYIPVVPGADQEN
ncbi:MAG: glycosyltransferase family 39 protein [Candidatus Moraniibacteriota bacterium]